MPKIQRFFLLIAIIAFFMGCKKPEDSFPPEPRIEFRSLIKTDSTLDVAIYFEDGDGDIDSLRLTPKVESGNVLYVDSISGNVILAKEDTAIYNCEKISYAYNIRDIEPVSSNGSMKGTITCSIDVFNAEILLSVFPQQRKYFTITLHDRAGNMSNELSTPYIE
ncbi:MAG: hypothetical protein LBF01_04125 [Bacteroidales bacterium]|jgi:hypothetical protein|nr:hypothetical protein [Bacteroidales bacterium]